MNQHDALTLLKLGKNIFLTGAAGAGKTYLLNQYIAYLHRHGVYPAITASTGIAATHIGGQTIHSWSGIGTRQILTDSDITKIKHDSRAKRRLLRAKVLIIDEISMLHAAQLDMVNSVLQSVRESSAPFGGIQLVLCGDFFQLPPVGDRGTEVRFAFEARSWQEGDITICYLHEQHRQGNDPLLTVLNEIRSGCAGEQTKVPLRTRYRKEPEGIIGAVPTKIYARNVNVDSINARALDALCGEPHSFEMQTTGFVKYVENLKRSCLAPDMLSLKIGAQVMFVKNAPDGEYVNGTRGIVTEFSPEDGDPVVRTLDGAEIVAERQNWEYEEDGVVRASLSQIPLRLAWAITVHKSQGMTLNGAEVDLSDAFEPGMGYVALSRVRSLAGLKLMGLNEMALRVHPTVLHHDAAFQSGSAAAEEFLTTVPQADRESLQYHVLHGRFEANSSRATESNVRRTRKVKAPKTSTIEITCSMLDQNSSPTKIAAERGLKLGTIVDHLEKLFRLGLIDSKRVDHDLPPGDFEAIAAEFKESDDGKLTPVHQKFKGKYDFDTLKLVRLVVGMERRAE